jgi:uncharacterized protein (DUF1697 family)
VVSGNRSIPFQSRHNNEVYGAELEVNQRLVKKKYISMLRGINVSGQKKIKMADLKTLYESLKFVNVKTYIQSGNIIFDSSTSDVRELKTTIEKKIEKTFGFFASVIIRSNDEFENIINRNPFISHGSIKEDTKLLVTFLTDAPPESIAKTVQQFAKEPEALEVRDKEIYLHCPNGYGKSKLSTSFFERKLGVTATTRNWKTVKKLYELSK